MLKEQDSYPNIEVSNVYASLEDAVRRIVGLPGILHNRIYVPVTEKPMFSAISLDMNDKPLDFTHSNGRCPVVVVGKVYEKNLNYILTKGFKKTEGNEVYEKGFILQDLKDKNRLSH